MKPIIVEHLDANSESARLIEWLVADGKTVERGEFICEIETQKAAMEVESPAAGILVHAFPVGAEVPFNTPIGFIAMNDEEASNARVSLTSRAIDAEAKTIKATRKAKQLAGQYGIDLAKLDKGELITEREVMEAVTLSGGAKPQSPIVITSAGVLPNDLRRVLILGAGLGAMQVIDILLHNPQVHVAGCLDDDTSMHGKTIFGIPVWGATSLLQEYWDRKRFDCAIVSISTIIAVRKEMFERCGRMGIPMINAIDPSARLNRAVAIGTGNVICSQVHIGVATAIGNNNFISAHSSIDHHNVWGSHNSTGPNCATSSRVVVGDEVKFGTGIFIEPGVAVGSRCMVASGAIITKSIPEDHAIKTIVTQKTVPLTARRQPQAK